MSVRNSDAHKLVMTLLKAQNLMQYLANEPGFSKLETYINTLDEMMHTVDEQLENQSTWK